MVNVAEENYKDGKEFARAIAKQPMGDILNPKVTEKIFNDYMKLDPRERMKIMYSDSLLYKFLAKYGIK